MNLPKPDCPNIWGGAYSAKLVKKLIEEQHPLDIPAILRYLADMIEQGHFVKAQVLNLDRNPK